MKKINLLLIGLILFGCKNITVVDKFPEDQDLARKSSAGNMFGNKDGIILLQEKSSKDSIDEITTNKKPNNIKKEITLWKKSVDTISNIAPILIIDEDLGLISTDWSNIEKISENNNLYKINIIVKGKELIKENLQISIFKKNNKGETSKDLNVENKILNSILK